MILETSPHGCFQLTQLCKSVAICEAVKGDRYGWGNATNSNPAFIAYLGCKQDEIQDYLHWLNEFYRPESCEIRQPKYLKEFEVEIKIRGLRKYSSGNALGLNHLVESEEFKYFGCNPDQYEYYATGVMQRW